VQRHTVVVVVVVAVAVVVPAGAGVICRQLQAEEICEAAYFDSAAGVVGFGVGFAPLLLLPPASTVETVVASASVMELVAGAESAVLVL
jgi:hypothetical protein